MKVAVSFPTAGQFHNQWDYVLSNFAPAEVWVIGNVGDAPPYGAFALARSTWVPDATGLPDGPLVVLSPDTGRHIQGIESLAEFTHPDDAVYLFGSDNWNLSDDELGGRPADHLVFVDTDTNDEMYSFVAYAVTAWDRRMKAG